MRFVHYEQGNFDSLQSPHETLVVEPLGRHIEQGDSARSDLPKVSHDRVTAHKNNT